MKNQYFGDVNDYSKYGLLRCFADSGLNIGVCWMLTPDDSRSDGRKIRYLSDPEKWKGFDPTLFDYLADAIREDFPPSPSLSKVRALTQSDILERLCARSSTRP